MAEEKHFERISHEYLQKTMCLMAKFLTPDAEYSHLLCCHKLPGRDSLVYQVCLKTSSSGKVRSESLGPDTKAAYAENGKISNVSISPLTESLSSLDRQYHILLMHNLNYSSVLLDSTEDVGIILNDELERRPSIFFKDNKGIVSIELLQNKPHPDLSSIVKAASIKQEAIQEFAELCVEEFKRDYRGGYDCILNKADFAQNMKETLADKNKFMLFVISNLILKSWPIDLNEVSYKPNKKDKQRIKRLHELATHIGTFEEVLAEHKDEVFNRAEISIRKDRGMVFGVDQIGPEWDFFWAHS